MWEWNHKVSLPHSIYLSTMGEWNRSMSFLHSRHTIWGFFLLCISSKTKWYIIKADTIRECHLAMHGDIILGKCFPQALVHSTNRYSCCKFCMQLNLWKTLSQNCPQRKIRQIYTFKTSNTYTWDYLINAHCVFIYFQEKSCPVQPYILTSVSKKIMVNSVVYYLLLCLLRIFMRYTLLVSEQCCESPVHLFILEKYPALWA